MQIYKKRGLWSVRNELCECDPCECDKDVNDVKDVEPVKVAPKTDWNLKNDKGRS